MFVEYLLCSEHGLCTWHRLFPAILTTLKLEVRPVVFKGLQYQHHSLGKKASWKLVLGYYTALHDFCTCL